MGHMDVEQHNDDVELNSYHPQDTHSGRRVHHGSAPALSLHSAGPHGLCAAVEEAASGSRFITTARPDNNIQKEASYGV